MASPRRRVQKVGPKRRTRNDVRRERNRKQLIDATLELVAQDGSGALTVTRIARAAGMDPSGFYAHFKSSKECEQAAAGEFDRYIGGLSTPYLSARAIGDAASATRAFVDLLQAWLREPRWSKLILRARYEESSFGRLMGAILDGVRRDVRVLLWDLALASGASGKHLDRIAALSEICVGNYMTLLEAVALGRVTDIELAASTIARANVAAVTAELKRIAREKEKDGPRA